MLLIHGKQNIHLVEKKADSAMEINIPMLKYFDAQLPV